VGYVLFYMTHKWRVMQCMYARRGIRTIGPERSDRGGEKKKIDLFHHCESIMLDRELLQTIRTLVEMEFNAHQGEMSRYL
jgi:hypothetical protein